MIIITAKKEGFRRCGIAHTTTPTEYPDGTFTKEQLATLKIEPNLVVQVIEEPKAQPEEDPAAKKPKKATPDPSPAPEAGK